MNGINDDLKRRGWLGHGSGDRGRAADGAEHIGGSERPPRNGERLSRLGGPAGVLALLLLLVAGCGEPTASNPAGRLPVPTATPRGDHPQAAPVTRAADGVSDHSARPVAEAQPAGETAAPGAGDVAQALPPSEPALPSAIAPREPAEAPLTSSADVAAPAAVAAPAPRAPVGQRPPPDRLPSRPGEAEKITFDDLNVGMQADVVYRPSIFTSDRVQELDGRRISILGYMHGGALSSRGIKKFVLLKNTECKFGPGGQADHLAQVFLRDGQSTEFTKQAVKVEGTLKVDPFTGPDGNTWSIYTLEDALMK